MFQSMDYIYEVYKTGSFSKAAKNLYLTQPALSIAVKKEEKELGQPIFERTSASITLTEAGKAYIDSIAQIKNIETSLRRYCNDLSDLKTGTIRLGASNFILSQIALPLISSFSSQYPGIQIDVREAPSLVLKNKLLNEELDVIIDPMDFDNGMFSVRPLLDDYFLLAVPKSYSVNESLTSYALTHHEICQNIHLKDSFPTVPLEKFSEEPFLLLRPESITYERAMKLCSLSDFTPQIRFYLDQLITSYHFVREELGIAFITDNVVKRNPPDKSVVFYKLNPELAKREISAVCKKNRYISKASLEFIKMAQRSLSS